MGITVQFLIKHVRPVDDGVEEMCDATTHHALLALGLTQAEVNLVFAAWRQVAALDPADEANNLAFAQSAWEVSEERWAQLYPTAQSTIVFLNRPLLLELAHYSSQHPGQNVTFDPAEVIPISVNIHRGNQTYEIIRTAQGFDIGVDHNGDCYHFARLNP